MRVMIIGAGGQLGSDLVEGLRRSEEDVVPLARKDLDLTDTSAVKEKLAEHAPEVIFNCSVYHPVDECESHPDLSFAVNATAVRAILE